MQASHSIVTQKKEKKKKNVDVQDVGLPEIIVAMQTVHHGLHAEIPHQIIVIHQGSINRVESDCPI